MKYVLTFLLTATAWQVLAQKDYSKDVASAEAIVGALYEVISGRADEKRDWARFRNLFRDESRLIPTRKNESGGLVVKAMTPEEYIQLFESRPGGFFETELHHVTETYGTLSHVFSTYETRAEKGGPVNNRGINSIQLFNDGKRYYVLNVFWCAESQGFKIPEKYLK